MTADKLNILLLSGANPYNDSGVWAYDIYKSLTQKGHSVLLLTRNYDERFESGIESIYGKQKWKTGMKSLNGNAGWLFKAPIKKIKYALNKRKKRNPDFYMSILEEKMDHIPVKMITSHLRTKIDVIIYLFPHHFLDSKNLYELNQTTGAPVFVMPVDMGAFTGGCHYANNCGNYKRSCGCCPGLYSTAENDLSRRNLLYKKKHIARTEIYTLANTWTSDCIKQSYLYNDKRNFYIDVVVDDKHYRPINQKAAKEIFSIPEDKKIIFFGASYLEDKRKGLSFLIDALKQLHEELSEKERRGIGIAIAGRVHTELNRLFSFDVYPLGFLSHEQLPVAFQMADVFVSPSIQDAGPMMVIQSMMCGTPVVAFEMGNAVDFILDGQTGFKAPLYDTKTLKEGIYAVLTMTEKEKEAMSGQCRETALRKSSYDSFEQHFISICKSVGIFQT